MKKNRMMRLASLLLVLVLMTSSVVGGTFAKYTTSASAEDNARVANWGFERSNSMDFENLFLSSYNNVNSENGDDVIAPGTSGSVTFQFAYDEANGDAPEVAYTFGVAVVESCDDSIKGNANILWSLDGKEFAPDVDENGAITGSSWDKMIAAIKALSGEDDGEKEYAANTLPDAFGTSDNTHSISWRWIFSNSTANDTYDTEMGNAAELADCSIKITITATQVD